MSLSLKGFFRPRAVPDEPVAEPSELALVDDAAPAPPPENRASRAHATLNEALGRMNAQQARIAGIGAAAQPAEAATSNLASLRQQRQAVIARQLEAGGVNTDDVELREIEGLITLAEVSENRNRSALQAQQQLVADLQAQHQRIAVDELPGLRRELAEAQFEAATSEIQQVLIPDLRAAAAQLGAAYARLAGAGQAHFDMANELRERHGLYVQHLGQEWPQKKIVLTAAVGFGISDDGNFNTLVIDASEQLLAAHAEMLQRWRSA